jgi:biopolymer transport protein TolQ
VGVDVISLIGQASLVVKLVLLLLAGFSVFSWAIIFYKWRELRRAEQDSDAFLEVYHEGSLDAAYEAARELDASPLATVFLAGYAEINRMARYTGKAVGEALDPAHRHALARHIQWTSTSESLRLERRLTFLATTGSATPFIGLFGTVIGIVNAFHDIGRAGSASLAVVAPGIAEALIATAVGLFAAIPATIAYNHFLGELRGLTAAIDLFSAEFEGDLARLGSSGPPTARAANG